MARMTPIPDIDAAISEAAGTLDSINNEPCVVCGDTGDTLPCITCNKLVCGDCGTGERWCKGHSPFARRAVESLPPRPEPTERHKAKALAIAATRRAVRNEKRAKWAMRDAQKSSLVHLEGEAREIYERALAKWDKKLKPLKDRIRRAQILTAEDYSVVVNL